jgi:hypothetical protein
MTPPRQAFRSAVRGASERRAGQSFDGDGKEQVVEIVRKRFQSGLVMMKGQFLDKLRQIPKTPGRLDQVGIRLY